MPVVHDVTPGTGDVLLLVGTMKGAFIFRASKTRGRWEAGGPYFPGSEVYAIAYDGRAGRRRIWAAPSSMHWGSVLRSSDDFGATWKLIADGLPPIACVKTAVVGRARKGKGA